MQETQETEVQSLEGNDNPLQYPSLKNPMGRGACQATQSKRSQRVDPDWAPKRTRARIYAYTQELLLFVLNA